MNGNLCKIERVRFVALIGGVTVFIDNFLQFI